MLSEALLSYFHLASILAMVVFLTSEGALCRPEWFNEAVLKRLQRVDIIYMICGAMVATSGITRIILGFKGTDWYIAQPMLHIKVLLFLVVGVMSARVSMALQSWLQTWEEKGTLPAEADIRRIRKWIMIEAHIIMVIPLFAVFLSRGLLGARAGRPPEPGPGRGPGPRQRPKAPPRPAVPADIGRPGAPRAGRPPYLVTVLTH